MPPIQLYKTKHFLKEKIKEGQQNKRYSKLSFNKNYVQRSKRLRSALQCFIKSTQLNTGTLTRTCTKCVCYNFSILVLYKNIAFLLKLLH